MGRQHSALRISTHGDLGDVNDFDLAPMANSNQQTHQSNFLHKIACYRNWTYLYSCVIACLLSSTVGYQVATSINLPAGVIIGIIIFATCIAFNERIVNNSQHVLKISKNLAAEKRPDSSDCYKATHQHYRIWMYIYSTIIATLLSPLLGYQIATHVSLPIGIAAGIITFLVCLTLNEKVAYHQHLQLPEKSDNEQEIISKISSYPKL